MNVYAENLSFGYDDDPQSAGISLELDPKGLCRLIGPASDILEPSLLCEVYGIDAGASADRCGLRIKGLARADVR
ncbi:hypothetical protein [Mailhella sp.]